MSLVLKPALPIYPYAATTRQFRGGPRKFGRWRSRNRTQQQSPRSPEGTNERAEVPKARMISFVMNSNESIIYPGDAPDAGSYSRQLWVYIPKQYVAGTKVPFMVTQDANYRDQLRRLLDNNIFDKKLPIMVVVFVHNGGGDAVVLARLSNPLNF